MMHKCIIEVLFAPFVFPYMYVVLYLTQSYKPTVGWVICINVNALLC